VFRNIPAMLDMNGYVTFGIRVLELVTKVDLLDAKRISAGPIAILHLWHHLPYGLHGSFTPEVRE
jgi:all-trans-8'-apo-beta-carotenal 15,15'-oxygenase